MSKFGRKENSYGHSNLARSSAQCLHDSLPMLVQFLSNPVVVGDLERQGRFIDWKEIVRVWANAEGVLDPDLIIISSRKSK